MKRLSILGLLIFGAFTVADSVTADAKSESSTEKADNGAECTWSQNSHIVITYRNGGKGDSVTLATSLIKEYSGIRDIIENVNCVGKYRTMYLKRTDDMIAFQSNLAKRLK